MEDSTTFRPISVQIASLKESITLFKEEVVIN